MSVKSNVYKNVNVNGMVNIQNGDNGIKVRIKKLDPNAIIPVRGSAEAAGADLYACTSEKIMIMPHETAMIHTGIVIELPEGTFGGICARGGLAYKRGLAPADKLSVIDSNYRGECIVELHNYSNTPQMIEPMERIAQLIVMPYIPVTFEEVNDISDKTFR